MTITEVQKSELVSVVFKFIALFAVAAASCVFNSFEVM